MNASALFEKIRVKNVIGTLDIQVNDITADSRTAKEGSIFVASKGYTVDSHKFCQDVIEQGCRIIVVNREVQLEGEVTQVVVPDTLRVASLLAHHLFDFPSHQLTIYGVTGTNGKTSTAWFTNRIWTLLGEKSASIGTLGVDIGSNIKKTNF